MTAGRMIMTLKTVSELLRAALGKLVVGDKFGPWILTQGESLPPDFELEL